MDFFEKLSELHANDVSPKKSKDVEEVNKEEVLQKVMDFVDKFDAKQRRMPLIKPVKLGILKPAARPGKPAAAKPAAKPVKTIAELLKAAKFNTKAIKFGKDVKLIDPVEHVRGIGLGSIQIVEGEGVTGKIKGRRVMPKVAKDLKRMKRGGGPIGGVK